jgi:hypothetical protein
MRNRVRIGLIAVAMAVGIAGRGCTTTPLPTAESLVAGDSHPVAQSTASSTSPPAPTAQTADERRADLDKQLDDSLGAFDDRLKKEQQKISEERDARQATVAAAATSAEGSGNASDAGGAAQASAEAPARGGKEAKRGGSSTSHAGDLKSEQATGASGSASGNGATATAVPDGNDDDVVARRIRRAAEQETDPELKDKLWKEYVEYKKNSHVR